MRLKVDGSVARWNGCAMRLSFAEEEHETIEPLLRPAPPRPAPPQTPAARTRAPRRGAGPSATHNTAGRGECDAEVLCRRGVWRGAVGVGVWREARKTLAGGRGWGIMETASPRDRLLRERLIPKPLCGEVSARKEGPTGTPPRPSLF